MRELWSEGYWGSWELLGFTEGVTGWDLLEELGRGNVRRGGAAGIYWGNWEFLRVTEGIVYWGLLGEENVRRLQITGIAGSYWDLLRELGALGV